MSTSIEDVSHSSGHPNSDTLGTNKRVNIMHIVFYKENNGNKTISQHPITIISWNWLLSTYCELRFFIENIGSSKLPVLQLQIRVNIMQLVTEHNVDMSDCRFLRWKKKIWLPAVD